MLFVSEDDCARLISRADAFSAVEDAFAAMSKGGARNFPVVRETIGHANAVYGLKSGFDRAELVLGVKGGGYWPGNSAKGLSNHQSTIFLFDPETGQLRAAVAGNYLTAVRTAAASAISIDYLARKDAKVLGIVGAGHQAGFQLRAAAERRGFEKIFAWNLHEEMLPALAEVARDIGIPFEVTDRLQLAQEADVIILITSAYQPLLLKDWVKPGTHIACMGTDTKGKQELDPALIAAASNFTDEIAQSITIGELQHAIALGLIDKSAVTQIGDVINKVHPGRRSAEEITVFDGTGVALQDLAVAARAVRLIDKDSAR